MISEMNFIVEKHRKTTTRGTQKRLRSRYNCNIRNVTWFEVNFRALGDEWNSGEKYCAQIDEYIGNPSFPTAAKAREFGIGRLYVAHSKYWTIEQKQKFLTQHPGFDPNN